NGFATVLSEVGKLEHITSELSENTGKTQDTTYYNDAIKQLANSGTIHVSESSVVTSLFLIDLHLSLQDELLALYKATSEQPINIDSIENRLLDIREKLIKLEENPELLKKGYKPYIPADSLVEAIQLDQTEQLKEQFSDSSQSNLHDQLME